MPITFRKSIRRPIAQPSATAPDITQRIADAVNRGDYDEAARICLESNDPAGTAVAASALFVTPEE